VTQSDGVTKPASPWSASASGLSILAVMLGYAVIVSNDTLVKLTGAALPLGEILFLRGVVCVVLLGTAALWFGPRWLPSSVFSMPVALRLAGEVLGTLSYLYGILHMPLGTANAIFQVTPLLVVAGAALVLKEPAGWERWAATVVGFLGTLLIVQPGTDAFTPYALLIVVCALAVAVRDLATRRIDPGIPSLHLSVLSAAAIMVTGAGLGMGEQWVVPDTQTGLFVAGAAVLLSLGYWLMTVAARLGDISLVAPFRYAGVPMALFAGWLVWGELPNQLAFVGIAVLIAAGLYAIRRA
jgi:drug/metabolite transporter (DMT)-like permease